MKTIEETLAEASAQVVAEIDGREFTRGELQAQFERVQNPDHWKAPINARVECNEDEARVIGKAIEFFTASKADVTKFADGSHHFAAIGYWRACDE